MGTGTEASGQDNKPAPNRWPAVLLPIATLVAVLVYLLRAIAPDFQGTAVEVWSDVGIVVVIFAVAGAVAYLVKLIAAPLIRAEAPAATDPDVAVRTRIAPLVLSLGSIAIVSLALVLVIAFTVLAVTENAAVAGSVDTLVMGVFGAVLPIVATWVGTVIAFYFTNDAYRQAAQSTRETMTGFAGSRPKVTSLMIPYDKIEKILVPTRTEADRKTMVDIRAHWTPLISRVFIFEEPKKNPIYVIRKRYSEKLQDADDITKYRSQSPEIAADSKSYGFLAETATVDEAKRAILEHRYEDVFVTRTGQPTEEVLGWISDDMVKGV
jgi:hypothetical protein